MNVIGYIRVSTAEQTDSGAGLDAQRAAIGAAVEARGWRLVRIEEDAGVSGGTPWGERPALKRALIGVGNGDAQGLMVAKLDRLTRRVADIAEILELSQSRKWKLIALDFGLDTSTPAGEMMANILASFSQYERRLIGQRTREGMAALRAKGRHMGRRSKVPAPVRQRIAREREEGRSLQAIAAGLNADEIPTVAGGDGWRSATVQRVLESVAREKEAARARERIPG